VCASESVGTGRPPVSMSHPSLRASTPIACNRHMTCSTDSAPPMGLCGARRCSAGSIFRSLKIATPHPHALEDPRGHPTRRLTGF
jgi:hypothetical protein